MERYKEYKETSIQWMKEIPIHWEEKKISSLFKERRTKVSDKDFPPLSVSKMGITTQLETAVKTDNGDNRKLVLKGDFVVNSRSDRKGSCGVSKLDGSVSLINIVLSPFGHINKDYFHHLARSNDYIEEYYRLGRGIVADLWTTRYNELKGMLIPLPPLSEQETIVNYIESRTSKIDAYIAEKDKEVQLLNELKEAEIAKVVTQGLTPDVKMKDSGISWIGMIPEHWEQYRFATICKEKSIYNCIHEELLSVYLDRGVIRFSDDTNKRTNPTSKDLSKYQLVEVGDFVLNNQQAWRGSVGVSNYRGIVSPAYFIFSLSPIIVKEYANYLFRSKVCVAYYYICSKGIGSIQRNLDWETLKQKKIAIPTIEEQQAIVAYINEKCSKITSLISELESEIDYLKEYKQRLIADCVTGQVNVQNEII